jgi:hypothetical protein
VNLNFARMEAAEKDGLINEIGNQTYRWMKGKQRGCGASCPGLSAFFKAQVTPEELQDAAEDIASQVVKALGKRGPGQERRSSGPGSVSEVGIFQSPREEKQFELSELDASLPSPSLPPAEAQIESRTRLSQLN